MKILLAGYNVDKEVLDELKKKSPSRDDVTPETLSASYARISRDPRPVDELRAAAREEVDKTRKSNRTIIFKMGHHSVAEHAVFNFDVLGVSRLAIEDIEKFRLCSFTEKSQRYISLNDAFVIPGEIKGTDCEDLFVRTVREQNAAYGRLFARLRPFFFEKYGEEARNPKNHSVLEGWAKEDARYVVSLATEGQLGLTVNARNLEFMIRRFASKELAELREIGAKLYASVRETAPSIILFTEANPFDVKTYGDLRDEDSAEISGKMRKKSRALKGHSSVRLVNWTRSADDRVLAALMHSTSTQPFAVVFKRIRKMTPDVKLSLMKKAFERMEFYDFPLREFEHADLTFELVVSASCFAQLKRHRMATLTVQPYDPDLGVTVPPSVEEIGAKAEFMEIMERTADAYARLNKAIGRSAAAYVLTNAHRRRALFKVNARELYHVSRLREDATAQWDIREAAAEMTRLARRAMPLTCLLLGGKDAYPELYEKVFGRRPAMVPPKLFS